MALKVKSSINLCKKKKIKVTDGFMIVNKITTLLYLCSSYGDRLMSFPSRSSLSGSIWKWKAQNYKETLMIEVQNEELF